DGEPQHSKKADDDQTANAAARQIQGRGFVRSDERGPAPRREIGARRQKQQVVQIDRDRNPFDKQGPDCSHHHEDEDRPDATWRQAQRMPPADRWRRGSSQTRYGGRLLIRKWIVGHEWLPSASDRALAAVNLPQLGPSHSYSIFAASSWLGGWP